MYFYSLALLGSPLELLTYHSDVIVPIGSKVSILLRSREAHGIVLSSCEKPLFKTSAIAQSLPFVYSRNQIKTAQFIAEYYGCSLGEALNLFVPFPVIVCYDTQSTGDAWIPHQVLDDLDTVIPCYDTESIEKLFIDVTLSPAQSDALDFIRSYPISLLFGDTGAGKSEIYMKRMEDVLQIGKRCLLLLPEISLTPQMEQRFTKHFGKAVVVWHSKMTPKNKAITLEKILSGEASVIMGPRSALFLPIHDLGLIVVDEEHDESYKSSSRPRYNARDMAVYIANIHKIPVVLGSATPSLSSYAKYPFFRLRGGYFSAKRKLVFEPSIEALTPFLDKQLLSNFESGNQAIVFIPTRANFKTMVCNTCGSVVECPFCSVGMSVHRNARALKCHYCNYTEILPKKCPKCHSGELTSNRLGTAEAVEHWENRFPHMRLQQFDRDIITTQNKLIKVLKSFNAREIDVLIGTQMLSKGHDYHDIALAIVMGIDNVFGQCDYRARERALSLLIQIAGRSGRKNDSTVVVQSFNESFFSRYSEDFEEFLKDELKIREGRYPPYTKLARLLFTHKNGVKAKQEMENVVGILQTISAVEVIGFGVSPIEKIADKYRFSILLRSQKSTDLIRAIRLVKTPMMEIDMDPMEFT